jgi:hypothetical protein
MKYVVITAKHHDGFSIYHSKYTDFDVDGVANWERDPLKELSDACKKHGLVFGVYYSHAQDWYERYNVVNHWDFGNPIRNNWYREDTPEVRQHKENMERYYLDTKAIPQVKELIDNYGVEMVWFDTAIWMPLELRLKVLKEIRAHKPDVVVNARSVGMEKGNFGDYRGGADNTVTTPMHPQRYWESILSTVHSWGYNPYDQQNRRAPSFMLKQLVTTVSKGGNLMINIGPKGDGTFPQADIDTLEYFADWMQDHSESIHGADRTPLSHQDWGVVTRKERVLYLHVIEWPTDQRLRVSGLASGVKSAELMQGGVPLEVKRDTDYSVSISLPANPSHETVSVIKLVCEEQPVGDAYRLLHGQRTNRLHVFDGGIFNGSGLLPARGKGKDAYVKGWVEPEYNVTWQVRQEATASYEAFVIYDVPKEHEFGGSYQLEVGDKSLSGRINAEVADQEVLADEISRMQLTKRWLNAMPTRISVDRLGVLELSAGLHQMRLVGLDNKYPNSELFRPRAIILRPH